MRLICLLASLPLLLSIRQNPQLQVVRELHSSSAFVGLTWSPDGQQIATHSNWGRTYTVWSAEGQRQHEFERLSDLPLYGNSLAFLADGQQLLMPHAKDGTTEGIFSVWDLVQSKVIKDVPGPSPGKAIQYNAAFHFAVNRDESAVAVVSSLLPNQPVTLYSTNTWTIIRRFAVTASVTSVEFSADSKLLAIGRVDGAIELYDLSSQKAPSRVIVAYDRHRMIPVGSLAFSPDSKFLAAGAGLRTVADNSIPAFTLWQISDLRLKKSDLRNTTPVRQISWTKDGNYVAVAAGDDTVRIASPLNHANGAWISVPFKDPIMSLGFAPNQDLLAIATGSEIAILSLTR